MAVVRTLNNGNSLTDWSEEINEVGNMYGLINGMSLFKEYFTSQESIVLTKDYQSATLIPQTSRRGKPASKGRDRKDEVFSLAIPYFSTGDTITPSDIQGQRQLGTAETPETLANVIATKMEDLRMNMDQTSEYMKLNAVKGITIDPDGNEIADMYDEFSLTKADYEVDWELSNTTFDVDDAIRKLKRVLAKNAKTGGKIGGFWVLVSPSFFDALVKHPKLYDAYLYYSVGNNKSDVVRGNLATFTEWGVTDTFEHQGVMFMSYDAEFTLPDGTVAQGIDDLKAHTVLNGVRDLYRAYYGPANTLSGANGMGSRLFMYQYRDPKDRFHELDAEFSPLYFATKPQTCITITAT